MLHSRGAHIDRTARTDLLIAAFGVFLLGWGAVLRVEGVHDAVLRSWLVGAPLVLFAVLLARRLWLTDAIEHTTSRDGNLLRRAALKSFLMMSMIMYTKNLHPPPHAASLLHNDPETYADVFDLYAQMLTLQFPLGTLVYYWFSLWEQKRRSRPSGPDNQAAPPAA